MDVPDSADASATAAAVGLPVFLRTALKSAWPFIRSALLTVGPDLLAGAALREVGKLTGPERGALQTTLRQIADGLD